MVAFPLIAAAVSAVFSVSLFRQWRSRRRLSQMAWGIALAMYAVASLAVAAGVGGGWDPTLYRAFWLFGALLNVPWLALGSIALFEQRAVSTAALTMVLVGTLWGAVAVARADVDRSALETKQIPSGRHVFCPDPGFRAIPAECDPVRGLARAYSLPSFLIVAGVAVATSVRRAGKRPPTHRIRANWLIVAGVTVNAIGGFALAGKGKGSAFSVVLVVSVVLMYAGFLLASKPAASPPREPRVGEP